VLAGKPSSGAATSVSFGEALPGRLPKNEVVAEKTYRGEDAMKDTRKSATTTATRESSDGFTAEERAAMKDRAQEMKAAKRRGGTSKEDGESDVLAKIAEMSSPDRERAERVHAVITACAPELAPRLWYGMPAYAKDGKVLCFFQSAEKFKSRYAMLGFSDQANLDDGDMWPTYFALTDLTAAVEKRIGALIKQAVS